MQSHVTSKEGGRRRSNTHTEGDVKMEHSNLKMLALKTGMM